MRRRVDEAMRLAGIYAYKDKAPHKLSGGQKQRVAIAGVLAMQPACLVLDEATAMLDPIGRQQVLRTVHSLNLSLIHITRFKRRFATRGVPRLRRAISKAPSGVQGTPRMPAERVTILASSSGV